MSEENETVANASDAVVANEAMPQTNGYGWTPEQQAEQRRMTALHSACGLRAPGHSKASDVLADAKLFDAFLSGVSE